MANADLTSEPGLRERSPGKWEIRAYNKGTGRQEYLSYDSGRREFGAGVRTARSMRSKLITDIAAGEYGGEHGTLNSLLVEYIKERKKRGASATTLRSYRAIAKAVARGPGAKRLEKLEVSDIDNWYADLLEGGMTPATLHHYHRLVSSALARATAREWIPKNVAKGAERPKPVKFQLSVPPPDRVRRLIDHATASRAPDMGAIIMTAALTGMRRGELCGLQWADIDWKGRTITVHRSVWQTGKKWGRKEPKTHQRRVVHLGPAVLATLDIWRRAQLDQAAHAKVKLVPDAYVFSPDADGATPKMPDVVTQRFGKFCVALEAADKIKAAEEDRDLATAEKWPYRFHDLRHYQASESIAAGVPLVTVSRRLGHAKVSTTSDIYLHDSEDNAIAAAGVLDAGLTPKELDP